MPGSRFLRQSKDLMDLLDRQKEKKKLFGAICTSPAVVLATAGLVEDGATCYPAKILREKIKDASDEDVVVQGNVITSQGPGTSLLFALRLGEALFGKEMADNVAKDMLVDRNGVPSYTVRLFPPRPAISEKPKNGITGRKRALETEKSIVSPVPSKACKESNYVSSLPILPGKDVAKSLKEFHLFQDIVWARLLNLGWKLEIGSRKSDTYYLPPGISRETGLVRKDYFDSRIAVLKYIEQHGGKGREVYDFFRECLSVGRELIKKRQLHKNYTMDFLENEVKRRKGKDLFHSIVWNRLIKLGWKYDCSDTNEKPMYIPPGVNVEKEQWILGEHYFDNSLHVVDFLDQNEEWRSKDSTLKIRELYNACLTVQKEYIASDSDVGTTLSASWIETETKKRKPYLANY